VSKDVEEILKKIEELRRSLVEVAKGKEIGDPEVIEKSRQLDDALNEYYRLLKKLTGE